MNTISGYSNLSAVYYQNRLADSQTQKAGSTAKADPLESLVESGAITEEQEEAIREALEAATRRR